SGSAMMLDFGKSFSAESSFFDEFLQPRTNSCLRDLLRLGLLPSIPGIYRHDLLKHADVWGAISDRGLPTSARSFFEADIESYDEYMAKNGAKLHGILISHGHTDHCQHLSYLDRRIPIFCSAPTYAILKAAEDINKGGFESDICQCPTRIIKHCGDSSMFPGEIGIEKDSTDCARDIRIVMAGEVFAVEGFQVEPIAVDHSVPGAFAYLIRTPSGKSVFYTGDIRFHGRFSAGPNSLTAVLRERTKGLRPDILITEGTRITSNSSDNEDGVEQRIRDTVAGCSGLAIVDFGWKDTTRFQTILNVAKATGRIIAVNPKVAYLWNQLRNKEPDAWPELSENENVRVYLKRTQSLTYSLADYSNSKHLAGISVDWGASKEMREAFVEGNTEYLESRLCNYYDGVRAYDIIENPSKYILHAGYFDMNELLDVNPPSGSIFVRAATEPFSDEMVLDEEKLTNWLDYFKINDGAGIMREHVSGHASGPDLLQFALDMQPGSVIPIHTQQPEFFEKEFGDKCEVRIPAIGIPLKF
ncbi:MAG: MBL fold metallo-hydrolase, partial [Lentisphaerae bacterium]|nr:MBL fold metallo-hydrolase [Lentisphaerota bacterium]